MSRTVGLVIAAVLSVLTLPVVVVLCLISAIQFQANPLFVQPRMGRHGRSFRFVKIRSLPVETPTATDKHSLKAVEIPAWGRFLRATHLDELPQLWHVVTRRMDLVGPRPEMPELAATFDPAFVAERTTVRPGITGLWQVSVGVTGLIGEHPEFDRYYVEHRSAALDAWILWRTVLKMLRIGELATLEDIPARDAPQRPESGRPAATRPAPAGTDHGMVVDGR